MLSRFFLTINSSIKPFQFNLFQSNYKIKYPFSNFFTPYHLKTLLHHKIFPNFNENLIRDISTASENPKSSRF